MPLRILTTLHQIHRGTIFGNTVLFVVHDIVDGLVQLTEKV